jgi:hypothetical protein
MIESLSGTILLKRDKSKTNEDWISLN